MDDTDAPRNTMPFSQLRRALRAANAVGSDVASPLLEALDDRRLARQEEEMRQLEDEARDRAQAALDGMHRAALVGSPFDPDPQPRRVDHLEVLRKLALAQNDAIVAASRAGFDVEYGLATYELMTGRVTLVDIVRLVQPSQSAPGLAAESLARLERARA